MVIAERSRSTFETFFGLRISFCEEHDTFNAKNTRIKTD
jgi:hypothetical protein